MSLFFFGCHPFGRHPGQTVNRSLSRGQPPVQGIFGHPAQKTTLQNRSGRDRTGRSDGLHPRKMRHSAGVLEYNERGLPPSPCPWYRFVMFASAAARGAGGNVRELARPAAGNRSEREGHCAGVSVPPRGWGGQRAVSSHPAILMHENRDFQLILPSCRQPGAGGRIASVFPCPAAAAGHWPAAAATKPTGPPAAGQGVTISGPLRFTNRSTAAQEKTQN